MYSSHLIQIDMIASIKSFIWAFQKYLFSFHVARATKQILWMVRIRILNVFLFLHREILVHSKTILSQCTSRVQLCIHTVQSKCKKEESFAHAIRFVIAPTPVGPRLSTWETRRRTFAILYSLFPKNNSPHKRECIFKKST